MPKGLWLILPAAFIDLAGAGISWALLALGSVLGTAGGAIGGAVAAQSACNYVGLSALSTACAYVGGLAGGAVGTLANPAAATIGVPLGIALGYAIQVCLGLTFGIAFIIFPLFLMRMLYPKYLFVDAFKLVPVLGWLPFWTGFVIASIVTKRGEEKKGGLLGSAAKLAVAIAAPEAELGAVAGAGIKVAAKAADLAASVQTKKEFLGDIRPPQRNYENAAA